MAAKSKTSRSGYVTTVGLGARRASPTGQHTSIPKSEEGTLVREVRRRSATASAGAAKSGGGLFAGFSAADLDRVRATMVPLGAEGRSPKRKTKPKV